MKYWFVLVIAACLSACGSDDDKEKNNADAAKVATVKRLTETVAQHPDSVGLRMRLINSLDSLKDYSTAIRHTDSLLMQDSLNEGLWLTKAHLLESNKDTAAAIGSYEKALRIYPAVEAQLYLANLYAETRNARALVLCRSVLQMGLGRETDANCSFVAAVYFARTGNASKALEGFDKAISDNYTLIEAYMEKGFIYTDQGQYAQALPIFLKATKVNGTYADAWYWLAKCYENTGDKDNALQAYQRALLLDKTMIEAKEGIKRTGG